VPLNYSIIIIIIIIIIINMLTMFGLYRAMVRGYAIACRPSVSLSVRDVQVP